MSKIDTDRHQFTYTASEAYIHRDLVTEMRAEGLSDLEIARGCCKHLILMGKTLGYTMEEAINAVGGLLQFMLDNPA